MRMKKTVAEEAKSGGKGLGFALTVKSLRFCHGFFYQANVQVCFDTALDAKLIVCN